MQDCSWCPVGLWFVAWGQLSSKNCQKLLQRECSMVTTVNPAPKALGIIDIYNTLSKMVVCVVHANLDHGPYSNRVLPKCRFTRFSTGRTSPCRNAGLVIAQTHQPIWRIKSPSLSFKVPLRCYLSSTGLQCRGPVQGPVRAPLYSHRSATTNS